MALLMLVSALPDFMQSRHRDLQVALERQSKGVEEYQKEVKLGGGQVC